MNRSVEPEDDVMTYTALINDEGQYCVWPREKDEPAGWRAAGFEGPKPAVIAHIDQVWTDMRPISLRQLRDS